MIEEGLAILRLLKLLGLPTSAAVILTVLLLEVKPMSLSELSRKTGYAKGHLSTSLRLLEEKSLIERITTRGRKVLFDVKTGAISRLVREYLNRLYSNLQDTISELSNSNRVEDLKAVEEGIMGLLKRLGER